MATIRRFEDIRAWQTARQLTRQVYEASSRGVFARDYGLRNQMQRASVSIMSNVAEGFESGTQRQFILYLGHAKASAGEVRAQFYVALDVGYLDHEEFKALFNLSETCSRQLGSFMAYLKRHPDGGQVGEGELEYEVTAVDQEPASPQPPRPSKECP